MASNVLATSPKELLFQNVQFGQTYTTSLVLTNNLKGSVEASIRSSASERLTVEPSTVRLKPGDSCECTVKLRVLRFANKSKAVEQGQRDILHIKGSFFDQKLYCTFFLSPSVDDGSSRQTQQGGSVSPRDRLLQSQVGLPAPAATSQPASALRRSTGSWPVQSKQTAMTAGNPRSISPQDGRPGSTAMQNRPLPVHAQQQQVNTVEGTSMLQRTHTNTGLEQLRDRPLQRSQSQSLAAAAAGGNQHRMQHGILMPEESGGSSPTLGPTSPTATITSSETSVSLAPRPTLTAQPIPRYPSAVAGGSASDLTDTASGGTSRADSTGNRLSQSLGQSSFAFQQTYTQPGRQLAGLSLDSRGGHDPSHAGVSQEDQPRAALQSLWPGTYEREHQENTCSTEVPKQPVSTNMGKGMRDSEIQPSKGQNMTEHAIERKDKGTTSSYTAARQPLSAIQPFAKPLGTAGNNSTDSSKLKQTTDLDNMTEKSKHASSTRFLQGGQTAGNRRAADEKLTRDENNNMQQDTSQRFAVQPDRDSRAQAPLLADSNNTRNTSRTELQLSIDALHQHNEAQVAVMKDQLKEAASQQLLLEATVQSQRQALADKDAVIEVLQGQLATLRQAQGASGNTASSPRKAAQATDQVQVAGYQHQIQQLQDANTQLQAHVKELEAQVVRYRDEASTLRRMQQELQARMPEAKKLIDTAVAREQVLQEERNRHALELLLSKDDTIEKLQAKVAELEQELSQVRSNCLAASSQLAAGQQQVLEVLRDKEELRAAMDEERQHNQQELAELHQQIQLLLSSAAAYTATQQQLEEFETSLQMVQSQLVARTSELSCCQDEAARLLKELSAAERRIQELQEAAQQEADGQQADMTRLTLQVHELEKIVEQQAAQLEVAYSAVPGRRLPQLGGQGPDTTAHGLLEPGLQQRLMATEALNKELHTALEEAKAELQQCRAVEEGSETGEARTGSQAQQNRHVERGGQDDESTFVQMHAAFEIQRLKDLLASRDRELVSLRAEAALLRSTEAALDAGTDQARELSVQLAESQLALQLANEKLAAMQARQHVAAAQQRAEEAGDASKAELTELQSELRRTRVDAQLAQAAAARLNARVTELCAAEANARSQCDQLQQSLLVSEELHARELSALEHRLQDAHHAASRHTTHQLSNNQPVGQIATIPVDGRLRAVAEQGPIRDVSREEQLQQAINQSEAALAVAQARLLSTMKDQVDLRNEIVAMRREMMRDRQQWESQVRQAREENALRIRTLEETLARLSAARGPGEQGVEIARIVGEMEAALRAHGRAVADVQHVQTQLAAEIAHSQQVQKEVAEREKQLAELWVYTALGPAAALTSDQPPPPVPTSLQGAGTSKPAQQLPTANAKQTAMPGGTLLDKSLEQRLKQQFEELTRRQHIIAELSLAGDKARQEADSANEQLAKLRASAPDSNAPHDVQLADMKKQLAACEAELQAVKAGAAGAELEVQRKQAALEESQRALTVLKQQAGEREAALAAAQDMAARKAAQVHGALSSELSTITCKLSTTEHQLAVVQQALDSKASAIAAADSQLAELRQQLAGMQTAAQQAQSANSSSIKELRDELMEERSRAREASQQAEQRHAQVGVLMETIEALQAGNDDEQQQQLLAITAQLAAARAREVALEQRSEELLHKYEQQQKEATCAAVQLPAVQAAVLKLEQQLATALALQQSQAAQLREAKEQLSAQGDAALQSAREYSHTLARTAELETEVESLRVTLRDIQTRHVEQLLKEREEAAESVRHAHNTALLSTWAGASTDSAMTNSDNNITKPFKSLIKQPLQDLLELIQRRHQDSPDGWVMQAMHNMQHILLELEGMYQRASVDAHVHKSMCEAATARLAAQLAALESRTTEWQQAQFMLHGLQRSAAKRSEVVVQHTSKLVLNLKQHSTALSQQLEASTAAEVAATSKLAVIEAALTSERAAHASCKAQLAVCQAEVQEVSGQLASGALDKLSGQASSTQVGLPDIYDQQFKQLAGRLESLPSSKERLLALMRELAAAKQSEATAQARAQAAQQRADALQLTATTLRKAAELAQAQLATITDAHQNTSETTSGGARSSQGTNTGSHTGPAAMLLAAASEVAGNELTIQPTVQRQPQAAAPPPAVQLAQMRAELGARLNEVQALREKLLASQQAAATLEMELSEVRASGAAQQLLVQQHKDEAAAALLDQRRALDSAHEADRRMLLREIETLQSRMATLRQLNAQEAQEATARLQAAREAAGQELDNAISRAMEGYVPQREFQLEQARAAAAERRAASLSQQIESLQQQLAKEKAQVMELLDVKEVTAAAVTGLESILANIEATAAAAPGVKPPSSKRKAADSNARNTVPATIDGLAKELVHVKLAEAEAVRKLRASARVELELRQKLLQKDERIAALKRQVTAQATSSRARSVSPTRERGRDAAVGGRRNAVNTSVVKQRPGLRSTSAQLNVPGNPELSALRLECQELNSALTKARLQSARKDAELERLKVERAGLQAKAVKAASPTKAISGKVAELQGQLAVANTCLAASLAAVNGMLRYYNTTMQADLLRNDGQNSKLGAGPDRDSRRMSFESPDTAHLPTTLSAALRHLEAVIKRSPLPTKPGGDYSSEDQRDVSAQLLAQLKASQTKTQELQAQIELLTASRDALREQLSQQLINAHEVADTTGKDMGMPGHAGGDAGQARRLMSLLQTSVSALQGCCEQLEQACSQPGGLVEDMKPLIATFASELLGLETTLDLLTSEVANLGPPTTLLDDTPLPRTGNQPRHSNNLKDKHRNTSKTTNADTPLQTPASTTTTTQRSYRPAISTGVPSHQARAGHGISQMAALHQDHSDSPSDSADTASELSMSDIPVGVAMSHAAAMNQRHNVIEPAPATSSLLAERLLQQKARTDKWKRRAQELGHQLALLGAGAAAREAAVADRVMAAERALEEHIQQHKADVARLEAALAGAQAAREALERNTLTATNTNATAVHEASVAEALRTSAAMSELRARCSVLERQLDTQRAQADAARSSLMDEVSRLRAALAQEQGERARLLGGMRDALAGLRTTGDTEGKLRSELLAAHQSAAAARSAQERAEAQASAHVSEVNMLRERLKSSEKARSDAVQRLQAKLTTAIERCDRLGELVNSKCDDLTTRLVSEIANLQTACEPVERTQRDLEKDVQAISLKLAAVQTEHQQDMESSALLQAAKLAEHLQQIELLCSELEGNKAAAARQVAELQVMLRDACNRAEMAVAELKVVQQRLADSTLHWHEERQQLVQQHLDHITELQSRVEQERQAMQQEAGLQCEATAAAREAAVVASAAASKAALEMQYMDQLRASEERCQALARQVEGLEAAFKAYQQQKAAEIASLEKRVVAGIAGYNADDEKVLNKPRSGKLTAAAAPREPRQVMNRQKGPNSLTPTRVHNRRDHAHANQKQQIRLRKHGAGNMGKQLHSEHESEPDYMEEVQASSQMPVQHLRMDGTVGDVLDAAATDAAAAARREALFERLQRQRAEALLAACRKAYASHKIRLKLVQHQLEALRAASVTQEDHQRVVAELESAKESLKAARVDTARHKRALQMLQSFAPANGTSEYSLNILPADLLAAAAQRGSPTSVPGQLNELLNDAASVTVLPSGTAQLSDPLAQVAATATATASSLTATLDRERLQRAALEEKLREVQAAVSRKDKVIREFRERVARIEAQAESASQAAASNDAQNIALSAAEAKLRQSVAALARKDVLVRELKAQLDAVTKVGDGGPAGASEGAAAARSQEQADRDARSLARLRADVARKDVAIQALTAELHVERERVQEAQAAALQAEDTCTALRSQVATAHAQAQEWLSAVRELTRLVMRCSAAAASLVAGGPATDISRNKENDGGLARSLLGIAGDAAGLSVHDIANLTSLTPSEVHDLLGDSGGEAGVVGPRNTAAAAAARARCEDLLSMLEATLLPTANSEQAGSHARVNRGSVQQTSLQGAIEHSRNQLDVNGLRLLVSIAEQEVLSVERSVAQCA